MDWNNDGRIDAHDYVHYKSVIDTNNNATNSSSSENNSYSDTPTSVKWFVAIIIIYVILKLIVAD